MMGIDMELSITDVEVPPPVSGDRPTGIAIITVTPAQSSAVLPGYYADELVVTTADGVVSTLWQGRIDVVPRLAPVSGSTLLFFPGATPGYVKPAV
jgi:hypothetical protein